VPRTIQKEQFNEREIIESGEAVHVRGSFDSKYIAVYGTLRLGEGNWNNYLNGTAEYIETRKIPGVIWIYSLAAAYVGTDFQREGWNGEWCTLDIFKINGEDFTDTNRGLDGLEGARGDYGYKAIAIPLEINGHMEIVKFYHIDLGEGSRISTIQDRALDLYKSPENLLAQITRKGFTTENTPNLQNFFKFYGKDTAAQENN